MYDARIFLDELDSARKVLEERHAMFKGDYAIHDAIYASRDKSQRIGEIFLRLRSIPKNIWNEKPFIVAIKKTELQEVGKQSIIPIKEQFDTEEAARRFVIKNYSDQFDFLYEFDRIGWQYDLGEDQVDLEDIEGFYSIEFKSPTQEGLKQLLALFDAKDVITGPSVVAIKDLLEKRGK